MVNILAFAAFLATAAASQLSVTRVAPVDPDVSRAHAQLATQVNPVVKEKVRQLTAQLATQVDPKIATDALAQMIQPALIAQFQGLAPDSPDLQPLVVLVMTELADQQEAEITSANSEIASMAKQRDALRAQIAVKSKGKTASAPPKISLAAAVGPAVIKAPAPLPPDATLAQMQKRVEDLADMSQSNQLRAQLLNDRRTKALDLAASVLRKLPAVSADMLKSLK